MSEGVKHDKDKVRYELLPDELLEATATILTFGANKYTTNYEEQWDKLLDVKDVVEINLTTAGRCVVHVTKNGYDNLTLNTQKDKNKTVGIGKNEILTRLRGTQNVGKIVQNLVKEMPEPNGWDASDLLDLQKSYTKLSLKEGVQFADHQNILTLTIATKQGNSVVSFAPSATTDSDFWEMMWKVLKEHWSISEPLNQKGDRNWELGMKWSRVYGALMRHLWSWWNPLKSSLDEETGKSHLWHAACCLAFLISYEVRGVGEDDRSV